MNTLISPMLKIALVNVLCVVLVYLGLVTDALFINANVETIIIVGFFASLSLFNFMSLRYKAQSFYKKVLCFLVSFAMSLVVVLLALWIFSLSTGTISGDYNTIDVPARPNL